ncbi:hypothetical protein GcM1_196025 [Golovinomyces cichoracearum]|uniref:Uncharacterized protein n=1 Tax=Golovinomyces cichoracearum TaxID=62708 RepID=A0A420J030_9PEZI|nr:hypothetical protein GcM1_196025 [Golovinomyces cichoracearum]
MNVADGTLAKLSYFSVFEIGVMGIWRKVEAFEFHLLLEIPWLHTVDAKLRIRDSIIEIGDQDQGKAIVKLQGPKFVESEFHILILCPKRKVDSEVKTTAYIESSSEYEDNRFWDSDKDSDDGDTSSRSYEESAGNLTDLSMSEKR